jgi:hypothetical protein
MHRAAKWTELPRIQGKKRIGIQPSEERPGPALCGEVTCRVLHCASRGQTGTGKNGAREKQPNSDAGGGKHCGEECSWVSRGEIEGTGVKAKRARKKLGMGKNDQRKRGGAVETPFRGGHNAEKSTGLKQHKKRDGLLAPRGKGRTNAEALSPGSRCRSGVDTPSPLMGAQARIIAITALV